MIEQGSEWILHVGKHTYDGYFALKEQPSAVTSPTPDSDYLHFYAKESGGATELFYKNSAGTERNLNTAAISSLAIGATVTSGTTGSLLFVGPGPVLAQDNANLFWDNTNKRLGIGTASPSSSLHVLRAAMTDGAIRATSAGAHGLSYLLTNSVGDARLFLAGAASEFLTTAGAGDIGIRAASGKNILFGVSTTELMRLDPQGFLGIGATGPLSQIHIKNPATANTVIRLDRTEAAGTGGPSISMYKTRGTIGSEGATVSGDSLGALFFGGHTGSAFLAAAARIQFWAGSTWSGSNAEAFITFTTTPSGSHTFAERLRIESGGDIAHATGVKHKMLGQNRFRYLNSIAAAYKTADQTSLTVNAWTTITFEVEEIDTDGIHSTSSNTSRFTLPLVGKWIVLGNVYINFSGITSPEFIGVRVIKNGSTSIIYGQQVASAHPTTPVGLVSTAALVETTATTDYVEIQGIITGVSGTYTILDTGAARLTRGSVYYVGE